MKFSLQKIADREVLRGEPLYLVGQNPTRLVTVITLSSASELVQVINTETHASAHYSRNELFEHELILEG